MSAIMPLLRRIAPRLALTIQNPQRRRELRRRVGPSRIGPGLSVDGLYTPEFVPLLSMLTADWPRPIRSINREVIAKNEAALLQAIDEEAKDPREAKILTGLATAQANLKNLRTIVVVLADHYRLIGPDR
ncbi:MAG: hypothetical protein IPO08_19520 [Xanthomonadales bacterium]|nr:hypothetical protein [Xanthomonadales bacterium]